MGKKDKKKGKGAEKTAVKTEKKATQKLKKELAAKGEEDIDSLLAQFAELDKKKTAIVEDLVPPPSRRVNFTLTAHPDKDQLILFGGEYFNGNKAYVYNDLFTYTIKQNRWIKITSPGGPAPRSAHQALALSRGGGQLWIFGGEFTSPSQSQFYHYKDLWVFSFASKKWEKISATGGPSSRSGHRMVALKKQIIVFGGFHESVKDYKYFNDVHSFNLEDYTWTKIDVTGTGPCPRSGCLISSLPDGKIAVYGGYSKERVKKDVDKGITHTDMYTMVPNKHDETGLKWRWQSHKQSITRPSTRCAATMTAAGPDRAVMFGGVCDEEDEDGDDIEGLFFNDLYQLDLNKLTWHEVCVTGKTTIIEEKKPRRRKKEKTEEDESGDDEEEESSQDENVEDKLQNMNVTEDKTGTVTCVDGVFTVTINENRESTSNNAGSTKTTLEIFEPPPRINCGLAVKRGILYLYGGMYEEGEKQLTLNDFYSLDLNKLDEWNIIIPLNKKDMEWFELDISEDEMDDEDDDDESDEGSGGMDTS